MVACILAGYFVLCYWLGRKMFLALEVTDSPGREIALPDRLQPLFAPLWQVLMPGHGGPLRSLITKELYLQRVSFGMAVVSSVVFFFGAASWRLNKSEWTTTAATVIMVTSFALNFLLNSLIPGGVCVAEERNWGMLGWQLSLPASKRSQWFVKVSVALGTSLVLGVIFPIAVFELCKWLFNLPLSPFTSPDSPLGNGANKPGNLLCFLIYLILLPCMAHPGVIVFDQYHEGSGHGFSYDHTGFLLHPASQCGGGMDAISLFWAPVRVSCTFMPGLADGSARWSVLPSS